MPSRRCSGNTGTGCPGREDACETKRQVPRPDRGNPRRAAGARKDRGNASRVRVADRLVIPAGVAVMARTLLKEETDIPLHILPAVIARQIRSVGAKIYRISVKRTHWHHYNISVRTRRILKELRPTETGEVAADPGTTPGSPPAPGVGM